MKTIYNVMYHLGQTINYFHLCTNLKSILYCKLNEQTIEQMFTDEELRDVCCSSKEET